jgi:hypothetical protein
VDFDRGQDLTRFEDALRDSEKVLELDPMNVKALFRRGQSKKGLENFKGAIDGKRSSSVHSRFIK